MLATNAETREIHGELSPSRMQQGSSRVRHGPDHAGLVGPNRDPTPLSYTQWSSTKGFKP